MPLCKYLRIAQVLGLTEGLQLLEEQVANDLCECKVQWG